MLKEKSLLDQQYGLRTIEFRNLIQCNQQGTVGTNENKWSEVIPDHNRRIKQVKSCPKIQQIKTRNRFQVLEQLRDHSGTGDGQESTKLRSVSNVSKKKPRNKCHKVTLIGDSHARECAQKLSNYVNNSYEVIGYVSPGAGLEVITNLANTELDQLSQEDLVVVCGGANYISKNNSMKGLSCVTKFIQHRRHTNVLLINALHRYDLEESSCVNKEVKIYNRELSQLVKKYNHADVIAIGEKREQYTKHGLHMNKKGKEYLSRKIADNIYKLFSSQTQIPNIFECNATPELSSSSANDPDLHPRAPTDPTNRECCEDGEIDSQKSLDQNTQPKLKPRVLTTPADQHTQSKLKPRLATTPAAAVGNANDSTEKETEELGREREEKEGDEGKEDDNMENGKKEDDDGKKVYNVEPYEQHFLTGIKQGLGHKPVRKYPVTRGNNFLWEI